MDQNVQFIITVGTVIGVFLWLRHDINLLNVKIDRVSDDLNTKIDRVSDDLNAKIDRVSDDLNSRVDLLNERHDRTNENIAGLRESLGWIRGRMGFTETPPPTDE